MRSPRVSTAARPRQPGRRCVAVARCRQTRDAPAAQSAPGAGRLGTWPPIAWQSSRPLSGETPLADPVAAAVGLVLGPAAAGELDRQSGVRPWQPPLIFVLWHSRILSLLPLHRDRGHVLLISRHRDGGYLANLAEGWGYRFVRGSTQRGGEVGLLGIVRAGQRDRSRNARRSRGPAMRSLAPSPPRSTRVPINRQAPTLVHVVSTLLGSHVHPWPFASIDVGFRARSRCAGKEGLRAGIAAVQRSLETLNA